MLQIITGRSEVEFRAALQQNGISIGDLIGLHTNSSGHLSAFFEDGAGSAEVPDVTPGAGGVSGAGGSGTLELGTVYTAVVDEVLGAVTTPGFTATTASQVVIPGTVVIDDSGATGPTLVDDGNGVLLDQTTRIARGVINYYTGDVAITYPAESPKNPLPTGNVEMDYSHSTEPDMTDMPEIVEFTSLVVQRLAGTDPTTDFTIFEDEAKTLPRVQGTLVFGADAIATFDLDDLVSRTMEVPDLTKRGKRWIEFSSADTYTASVSWRRLTS